MNKGTVRWFNPVKGYGFIMPEDGTRDVFIHISTVESAGVSSLKEGQAVEYDLTSDDRGRSSAGNLHIVS